MARYDSQRKIERNKLLAEYQKQHPDASLAEVGEIFQISPQRVWELNQIQKRASRQVEYVSPSR